MVMKIAPEIKIAVVVSRFNQEVTERLWQGARERLLELGLPEGAVTTVRVPGAIEIPLMAQMLAQSKHFAAIICLGAVIQGETDHYDYVCQQVSYGCQQVALQQQIPVIFGVLTTQTEEQALARAGGDRGHKGREAVETALAMITALQSFQTPTQLIDQIDANR